MNYKICGLLLGFFLLAFPIAVFAQSADDVQARLSLAGGKTVFRSGEPVRLELSFTADKDGYTLNERGSNPQSRLDELIVSPATGVFQWAKQYNRGSYFEDDVIINRKLSAEPTTIKLTLNDFVRFDKPGNYSVLLKTKRISTGDYARENRRQIPLTTNEINFEIKEMSEAEEEQEVKRLSALLDGKQNWQEQAKFAEDLSYLAGEVSTREKLSRFFTSQQVNPGNYFGEILNGLFIARDKALIIKSLENVLRDPNREVDHALLGALTQLRLFSEDEKNGASENEDFQAQRKRADEIRQIYLRELIESLPKRAARNRATVAITILDNLPRENPPPDVTGKLREILTKEFDNLSSFEQERLLGAYWNLLRDSLLAESLVKILSKSVSPQDFGGARTIALERLIELDEAKARPFVIAEVRNPNSFVNPDVLIKLSDPFLPEVDDALLEQIREFGQLKTKNPDYVLTRIKSLLAARYATSKIYDGLMQTYQNCGDQWFADAKGALLGYFARHNDKEAVPLIEQALAKMGNGSEFTFLLDLTKVNYTPGMNELLRRRLNSDDPQAAGTAAYLMSKYGTEENKKLIEERLDRWLKEWKNRAGELEAAEADDKIALQKILQASLISALLNAKAWKLSSAESERLKQSCLTERCRQNFRNH